MFLVSITFQVIPIALVSGDTKHYYREYDVFLEAFMELTHNFPEHMNYEVIGKTVKDNNIILFAIGDPKNPKILFDGAMHGEETLGSEILYLYAKWLLTSNDPLAIQIITNTYTLLIPALNVDNYNHLRTNENHVDLNRNFVTRWERAGSSDPESWYYHGPAPSSEPETQVLLSVFERFQPVFYINLHFPGGTYYLGSRYGNHTRYEFLIEKIETLANEQEVDPYQYRGESGGSGLAISDAAKLGITSFLVELHDEILPLSEIEEKVFPRFLTIACGLSQTIEPEVIPDFSTDVPEFPYEIPQLPDTIPEFPTTRMFLLIVMTSIFTLFFVWKLRKANFSKAP